MATNAKVDEEKGVMRRLEKEYGKAVVEKKKEDGKW